MIDNLYVAMVMPKVTYCDTIIYLVIWSQILSSFISNSNNNSSWSKPIIISYPLDGASELFEFTQHMTFHY